LLFVVCYLLLITFSMTNQPPQQPQTQFSQILTQAVKTLQAKVNFSALTLKKGAKVPELRIKNDDSSTTDIYPLLGERYLLGRSSKSCDIVVRNPVVSQIHLSIERDPKNPRYFIIKDRNSTNGVYQKKHRIQSFSLRHGDIVTLGPPQLKNAVEIRYFNPPPGWVYLLRYFVYGTSTIVGLAAAWIGFEWSKILVYPLPQGATGPVVVYARDGTTPLSPLEKNTHRELERLTDFSPYLPQAVVASEDSRYYWHFGVDPIGILRALMINRERQQLAQGGSTLTQQLARSLFPEVGRQNTAARKLREILVATKLEAFYSKDEILKNYLNRIYLGVGNYGFEDAAQFYFNKSAADLTISEAATLVAILPAPNSYNPVRDYATAQKLRDRVITRMAQQGMIDEQEANRARRSRIEVSPKARATFSNTIAPYFYSYIFDELRFLLGEDLAKEGNFVVESSVDLNTQKKAEASLRNAVATNGIAYRFSQGAIVTLNTSNGEILAMVGGTDYEQSQFNRAVSAKRQPGSTFKAFTYAAALEQGISPYTAYSCGSLVWRNRAYRGCERSGGSINMYTAVAQSENAVAMRVAQSIGLDRLVEMAQNLGIRSKLEPVPGLVIGQSEVNVLEITGAYATFANRGIWNRPHGIKRIFDASDCTDYQNYKTCRIIYEFNLDPNGRRQAISAEVANTMTSLLRGVVSGGTGGRASLGLGEAGKTGTTDKGVDLWFIGYIPKLQIISGIWLGNDNNSPTRGSSGQAAILWGNYMKQVTQPAATAKKNS
jgi:1A family penicillin-binding protein